jgi:signal transduction histidine kinase
MPVSFLTRWRILETGLFLPVVVTAVLGAGYLKAVLARERAVDRGAQLLASRALDSVIALAEVRGNAAAYAIVNAVHNQSAPTLASTLATMKQVNDSLRACRCGPIKEGAYMFVWVPSTGERLSSGPVPPRRHPSQWLGADIVTPQGSPQIWAPGGIDSTGPWLLHYTMFEMRGRTVIAGFDISMDSWWSGTFAPAIEAVRRQLFPMLAHPDSAFSAALKVGETVVAGTGARYSGVTAVTSALPPFRLEISLNPAALSGVLAPAAPPAYPVLAGALSASLIVSILSLLLLRQIRRTMALREAFVASISHEVRTPLTEILLHAESLHLNRQTPEANGRAAASIVRETRRVIGLVENALTIAGAGRERQRHEIPQPVRLAPIVHETLRSLEHAARSRGARIDAELDEQLEAAIDPFVLDRIVTNLVENALRYGPHGQAIRVSLARDAEGARLDIDDQGPGVPAHERQRIWDPFERGEAGRGSGGPGIGLGLAIVHHLVESAGGRVTVGDAPGGGARFTVNIATSAN